MQYYEQDRSHTCITLQSCQKANSSQCSRETNPLMSAFFRKSVFPGCLGDFLLPDISYWPVFSLSNDPWTSFERSHDTSAAKIFAGLSLCNQLLCSVLGILLIVQWHQHTWYLSFILRQPTTFWGVEFLRQKMHKFVTKIASGQNSRNQYFSSVLVG